jgi:hypothetical protein
MTTTDASLSNLPGWLLFVLIVCGSLVLASAGLLAVRRWMKTPEDEEHNVLVSCIFATVSLVYTVLLAFLVIAVWETFNAANQAVSQEAAAIVTVARDAELLPEPLRSQTLNQLHIYTEYVINDEWHTMHMGAKADQIASPHALAAMNTLWIMYRKDPSSTSSAELLQRLDDLSEQREVRLMSSQDGLPDVFWFVLVIGAIITISFSLILRVKDIRLHMAMILLLTGVIAICLWLIVLINNPFVGNMQVSSEPLKYALYVIDTMAH